MNDWDGLSEILLESAMPQIQTDSGLWDNLRLQGPTCGNAMASGNATTPATKPAITPLPNCWRLKFFSVKYFWFKHLNSN